MNSIQQFLYQFIGLFIVIPLIGYFVSLPWKNKQERAISFIVLFTKSFYIITTVGYALLWILNGADPINERFLTLYETDHFVFAIQFYYDHVTAVFSIVGAVLFFLVSTFSRYYMHRDEGFKRFFNTILFFALGFNLIIFSGNFETMFIGWEIIGISSFLLIAFYRNRYLPVKNAFKVISYYRISDVALMLAMWLMHHLTHQNILFTQLTEAHTIVDRTNNAQWAVFISMMIVLAAMIKSAQFPFTSWLPRAMEGPTSSSAIFYGSLSVHIGVFLLIRTYPFWKDIVWIKVFIIVVGALTALIGTFIARVQPTIKTQISYSSAAQIGIIFIEVALGLHILALVHFAGNAFLRTYQLLVSPSVLNYLVHHQYFHYHPPENKPVSRLRSALYMLGVKEWNLDTFSLKYLWSPFKWLGNRMQFLGNKIALVLLTLFSTGTILMLLIRPEFLSSIPSWSPVVYLVTAFVLSLFAFSYRGQALHAWISLFGAQVLIISGICLNTSQVRDIEIVFYGSGVLLAFILGIYCLLQTKSIDGDISLARYHGYVFEQKKTGLWFLIAALSMLGFPVTAAFIGIDIFFTYVGSGQYVLIGLLAFCLIFIELSAIRIFTRVYLGLHKKLDHPVAFRSS